MAIKHFEKEGEFYIFAGVTWVDWALPLAVCCDLRRPWPQLRIHFGPFYFGCEWFLGHATTSEEA